MLRQLELVGFKSFADRTAFEFAAGVTCVVGPNGSGKSNVVDAIKWILGDQSPKSLRGKEMADVIFNGAQGRGPSGLAEASLTFDNTDGRLPVDATEVHIGRRLYRSGESEYLLNGNVVRLKDVRDIFLGGAGSSAYAIIEQGRVDQILQANPTSRRVVFEEAAGISRYKNRRVDAERKLERVALNLTRLTDIVDEVEAQLHTTRSQAAKAAKYRELSTELHELWTGVAADDYRTFQAQIAEVSREIEDLESRLQSGQSRLAECEQQRGGLEDRLADNDRELGQSRRESASRREQIAAQESAVRHQSARQREVEADLRELRDERARLAQRAHSLEAEIKDASSRLDEFEERLADQRAAIEVRLQTTAELKRHADIARERIAECRGTLAEQSKRRTQLVERISVLEARSASADDARRNAHAHSQSLAAQVADAEAAVEEFREKLQQAEEAHSTAQAESQRLSETRRALQDEHGDNEKSLAAMREQRVAWEARIHVLEDLDRRQEGLGVGVREILHRAKTIDAAPWNTVRGCVGDLLEIPLEHAALLEVALGSRAQVIVTDHLESIFGYFNSRESLLAGRVGFVENGPPPPDRPSTHDLTGEEGIVIRADRLAADPARLEGLAERMLSDTWFVESLPDARRLSGRYPGRLRFVTLQGELWDENGVVYAGNLPNETSLVSRKSELRRLRRDLQQLDEEIAAQSNQLRRTTGELSDLDGSTSAAEDQLRALTERVAEIRLELRERRREHERLHNEHQQRQAEVATAQEAIAALAAEAGEARAGIADAEQKSSRTQDALRVLEANAAEIDGAIRLVGRELEREQLELAKHEERAGGLRETQTRLEQDLQQRQQHVQEVADRLADRRQTLHTIVRQILQVQAAVTELYSAVERIDAATRQVESVRNAVHAERAEIHREEERLRSEQRRLGDAEHALQLKLREIRHQSEALAERIDEEYQLRVEDLVMQGVSVYQQRIAELTEGAPIHEADLPSYDELRPEFEQQLQRLRRKVKSMGHVNTEALENLDELETRYERLSSQLEDLSEAKATLEQIIRRINSESRRMFLETFESIRQNFRELFRKLFGGGEADIVLEDPDDVLDCGIDIVARPPGKELRSITLLSGGEKTLTAVALLFAMFQSNPSPYCILDEVDAALDEANVERYASILREFVDRTQFVVITHRKRTMTVADTLYGVTMEQGGVSKRMSVRFEDVADDGEIRTKPGHAA